MAESGSPWRRAVRHIETDVVVVGAGLSGLLAATRARAAGLAVTVLEASARVGGRTLSREVGSQRLDLGGQWFGPTQPRIALLARELGIRTVPHVVAGRHLFVLAGKVREYHGRRPRLPFRAQLEARRAFGRIERMSSQISPQRPWAAPSAVTWDGMTVRSWAERYVRSRTARGVLFAIVRSIFCAEPGEIGFLHFLFCVRSAGGLLRLAGVQTGTSQESFAGGAQQLCEKLAERLAPDVHLSAPARAIEQDEDEINVYCDGGAFTGRYAIVAVPPALAGRIAYDPPLPVRRDQLMQRMPQGSSIKFLARYGKPFWREKGYSGQLVADIGPVQLAFDGSREGADPAVLVGFVLGEEARRWSAEGVDARRNAVLADLGRFFGREATEAVEYVDKDWGRDPWVRGCPASFMPAGTVTACGRSIRESCGRIHWAGSETAVDWAGHMEGAVEAGDRAAREVIERFKESSVRATSGRSATQAPK